MTKQDVTTDLLTSLWAWGWVALGVNAALGVETIRPGGAVVTALGPARARHLVFAVRRGLEKVGRNVNDIIRFALGTREVRTNAAVVLAALGPALDRLDAFTAQVGRYFPGLELHR